jgi:hypothetical protein
MTHPLIKEDLQAKPTSSSIPSFSKSVRVQSLIQQTVSSDVDQIEKRIQQTVSSQVDRIEKKITKLTAKDLNWSRTDMKWISEREKRLSLIQKLSRPSLTESNLKDLEEHIDLSALNSCNSETNPKEEYLVVQPVAIPVCGVATPLSHTSFPSRSSLCRPRTTTKRLTQSMNGLAISGQKRTT